MYGMCMASATISRVRPLAMNQFAIDERTAARRGKNSKESDRIRDELAKMGVVLKDTKDGTTWEIAR